MNKTLEVKMTEKYFGYKFKKNNKILVTELGYG